MNIMKTILKNHHPHQCSKHHNRNSDSILRLPLPMRHKQDISYHHLKINQYQSKHANDYACNLVNGNIFPVQEITDND